MRRWFVAILWAAAVSLCPGQAARAGVLLDPKQAPDFQVREWVGEDPGSMTRLRDKVVLIEFFQLWCPGSNAFSIPLFDRWEELYGGREDVVLVSIHSVFEGHEYQTDERLREFIRQNGIERTVGIDALPAGGEGTPETMKRFGALGTPHVVIVDKEGDIRFSAFGPFDIVPVEAFIDRLLGEGQTAFGRAQVQAPAETPDLALSGSYVLTLEQTSMTCGRPTVPFTVGADVEVFPDTVRVEFSQSYMDFDRLTLHFEPRDKSFLIRTRRRAMMKDGGVTLSVDVTGRFLDGPIPPELELEARVERKGDDPGQDCHIELRGRGKKTK
jgi:thiol-disulfide isomerase/thioredoxin